MHALWLLDSLGATDSEIIAALDDPDAGVRWNAAHILGERGGAAPPEELMVLVLDDDPRVLLEALIALGNFDMPEDLAPAFVELYLELDDDWTRSAVIGVFARHPAVLLAAALSLEDQQDVAPLAIECAARVARAGDGAGLAQALQILGARTNPDGVGIVLTTLARELADGVDLEPGRDSLQALLGHERIEIAIATLPLAARLSGQDRAVRELTTRLVAISEDFDADLELRLQAVEAMLDMPGTDQRRQGIEASERFLDAYFSLDTQLRVIDGVGRAAEDSIIEQVAAQALVAAYPSLSNPARERAFHHILQRPDRVVMLFAAIQNGDLRTADLGPHRRHQLENHADALVAEFARELFKKDHNPDKEALIASLSFRASKKPVMRLLAACSSRRTAPTATPSWARVARLART